MFWLTLAIGAEPPTFPRCDGPWCWLESDAPVAEVLDSRVFEDGRVAALTFDGRLWVSEHRQFRTVEASTTVPWRSFEAEGDVRYILHGGTSFDHHMLWVLDDSGWTRLTIPVLERRESPNGLSVITVREIRAIGEDAVAVAIGNSVDDEAWLFDGKRFKRVGAMPAPLAIVQTDEPQKPAVPTIAWRQAAYGLPALVGKRGEQWVAGLPGSTEPLPMTPNWVLGHSGNTWVVTRDDVLQRDADTWRVVLETSSNLGVQYLGQVGGRPWIGADGTLPFEWTGQAWKQLPPGVATSIRSVWGVSAEEHWLVAHGRVYHRSGIDSTIDMPNGVKRVPATATLHPGPSGHVLLLTSDALWQRHGHNNWKKLHSLPTSDRFPKVVRGDGSVWLLRGGRPCRVVKDTCAIETIPFRATGLAELNGVLYAFSDKGVVRRRE